MNDSVFYPMLSRTAVKSSLFIFETLNHSSSRKKAQSSFEGENKRIMEKNKDRPLVSKG